MGNRGTFPAFRAITFIVLLLSALIGGLWAGMSLSTVVGAPDRGLMDWPY
jgi:hypothetical protein